MSVVARIVRTHRPKSGETVDSPRHFRTIIPLSLGFVEAGRLQQLYQQDRDVKSILSSRLKDRSHESCNGCVEKFIPCTSDDGCSPCDWCSLSNLVCIRPNSGPAFNTRTSHLRHYRLDYADASGHSEHRAHNDTFPQINEAMPSASGGPTDTHYLAARGAVARSGSDSNEQVVGSGNDRFRGAPIDSFGGRVLTNPSESLSASTLRVPDMQGASHANDYMAPNVSNCTSQIPEPSGISIGSGTTDLWTEPGARSLDTEGALSYEDIMEIFGSISPSESYGGTYVGTNTLEPGSAQPRSVVTSWSPGSSYIDVERTAPRGIADGENPQSLSRTHSTSLASEDIIAHVRVVHDIQDDINSVGACAMSRALYDAQHEYSTMWVSRMPGPGFEDSSCVRTTCGGFSSQQQSFPMMSLENNPSLVSGLYARSGVGLDQYSTYPW